MTVYLAGMAVLGLAILAMQVLAEIDARHRYEATRAHLDSVLRNINDERITSLEISQQLEEVRKDFLRLRFETKGREQ